LQVVYAHGNGALKSNFYDAFVSIKRGLFNTRDRDEHTRKRKIIAHIFSQKSVVEFEPHIRLYVQQLLDQWDRLYDAAVKGMSGTEGEGGWSGRNGRLWLDLLPCRSFTSPHMVCLIHDAKGLIISPSILSAIWLLVLHSA
jgi:benzoate 4-monooxygenase